MDIQNFDFVGSEGNNREIENNSVLHVQSNFLLLVRATEKWNFYYFCSLYSISAKARLMVAVTSAISEAG